MDNYFVALNQINVNDHVESKNGLKYLSWAWAWAEVKKEHPDANYTIYENKDSWFYHTDGKTCWVKTGVTVNGIEHVEYLPVMDFKNRSIPVDNVTSFDVNKAIQRSLTKAVARHGLGLYIYAGEDLPETDITANMIPADPAPAEHPKADKPATVVTEDPREKSLHQLRMNAKLAYGSNSEWKLDELLRLNGVTFETMTNEAYKAITKKMADDMIGGH